MVAFQELIRKKQIDISYMTTHEFPFNDAAAFDLIINKKEPFIGIALKYDIHNTNRKSKIFTENKNKKPSSKLMFPLSAQEAMLKEIYYLLFLIIPK